MSDIGIDKIAVKGFRYSDKHMKDWAKELIPVSEYVKYQQANEKEILLGEDYIQERLNRCRLIEVNFREYVHAPNGIGGVLEKEAQDAMKILYPQCVISSSNPKQVFDMAIARRIRLV